jgi:hypothetical protein
MFDDVGQGLGVLLLEDDSGVAVEDLSLSIDLVEVETVRVRARISSHEM